MNINRTEYNTSMQNNYDNILINTILEILNWAEGTETEDGFCLDGF